MLTGKEASKVIGIAIHFSLSFRTRYIVAPKAVTMVATERKSEANPVMSFFGRDSQKSSSA